MEVGLIFERARKFGYGHLLSSERGGSVEHSGHNRKATGEMELNERDRTNEEKSAPHKQQEEEEILLSWRGFLFWLSK